MNIKTIFFDVYHTLLSVDFSGNKEAWNVFSRFLNGSSVSYLFCYDLWRIARRDFAIDTGSSQN